MRGGVWCRGMNPRDVAMHLQVYANILRIYECAYIDILIYVCGETRFSSTLCFYLMHTF